MQRVVQILMLVVASTAASAEVTETRYLSEGVSLVASFYAPGSGGPTPGVVIIHGSGVSARDNVWARGFAEALAQMGYAVLYPDKRGSGFSGGDWRQAGMQTLARDAIAGAQWMRGQASVDSELVGYLGLSQGGHVAPLAASMDSDAAFVISVVSSLKTMEEQVYDELDLSYRKFNLDDATIAYLQEMAYASFDYIRTGEGWGRYIERRNEISAGPLTAAAQSWPTSQDDPYWDFWRLVWNYDPKPHWHELIAHRNVPALMIWGTGDRNVKVEDSLALARQWEADPDLTMCVYEGGGHALRGEGVALRRDMLDDLQGWLLRVTGGSGEARHE